ncbi:MAG: hypothetical protein PHI71_17085, partial [Acidiphilium sp.]|nr:hypothetical protein [Acidiphilium sp.]
KFFIFFSLGTATTFSAMFTLGFMGMTRRLDYLYDPHWQPLLDSRNSAFSSIAWRSSISSR